MRLLLAIFAIFCMAYTSGYAQPRSLGGVFSYPGIEVSYQQSKTNTIFFEINAGITTDSIIQGTGITPGVKASFTYNFLLWGHPFDSGILSTYAGVGVSAGFMNQGYPLSSILAGLCGRIGLEYRFKVPVILSVDLLPLLGLQIDTKDENSRLDMYKDGITKAYYPRVGIRYCF